MIHFIDNVARKQGPPSLLRVELAKSQKASHIGEATGLFSVPRVLSLDEDAGVLDFERIRELRTIGDLVLCDDPRLPSLLDRAGRSLAVIHDRLALDAEMRMDLPAEWKGQPADDVFLHGDYTSENVCVNDRTGRLVIVDWSTAPLMGRVPTYGTRYFDILWFAGNLFETMPLRRVGCWHAKARVDAFLCGYVSAPGACLNRDLFGRFYRQMCRLLKWKFSQRIRGYRWYARVPYCLFQAWVYAKWRSYHPPPACLTS